MKLLKNILVLLLLSGFYYPSYAAFSDIEAHSCGIYNEEKAGGEEKTEDEEEEPDCE